MEYGKGQLVWISGKGSEAGESNFLATTNVFKLCTALGSSLWKLFVLNALIGDFMPRKLKLGCIFFHRFSDNVFDIP